MGINIEMISHNSVVYGGIKSRNEKKEAERERETKHTFKFHEFLKRATKKNETNYNELYLYCPREKPTKHFGVFRLKYILYYIYIHVTKNVFFSSSSR